MTSWCATAATEVWNGASGTDLNWSTGGNWVGSVAPTTGDDVKFYDAGGVAVPGSLTSTLNSSLIIGSLQFGQTNNQQTLAIASGQTLAITNGNLVVGTPTDVAVAKNLTNTITGSGATLIFSNPAAVISLAQGSATGVTLTRGNLDLSSLDTFLVAAKGIGLGFTVYPNPGNAVQREAGSLILAKTNVITLALTDTLANYQTAGRTNAIELARNPGNNAAILSQLVLGQSNIIQVDSVAFGRDKASASSAGIMYFNPAFTNNAPVAQFRGPAGGTNRVTWWAISDMNASASSAQVAVGTNDFSNGSVDALVDVMSLARDCNASHSATVGNNGVLTFNGGTIDVNTLYAGNQALGPSTSANPCWGTINVGNPGGVLTVNNSLVLGRTTQTSVSANNTRGTLNIRSGGVVHAASIAVGTGSLTNTITMNNATLFVSNAIASSSKGLTFFTVTNSVLHFNINGSPNAICTNLVSGGTSNFISPDSVAVFATYPTQVVVIKYVNQVGLGGNNFALTNLPASAPGAYLSNNVANGSLDLVLPFDPRPVISSQPAGYSGNPGDNVVFNVSVSPNSVTPVTYQWYLGTTALVDGTTVNGSVIAGSTTAALTVNNAQPGDNGNYTVSIVNVYGAATSAPPAVLTISAGSVAPNITGPASQTVIQGNNAVFSASVSGNPAPGLQWYRNGAAITGETGLVYTLTGVQYPVDDGAVFSLVATNAAGNVTNSATLTVTVPPSISVQPVSQIVTNSQGVTFTVTGGGVPTPTYQWYFNNGTILNATNDSLTIASTTPANIGTYKVVLNNSAGVTTSSNAALIVHSTMSVATLAPANNATAICPDTPLYLTFNVAPTLRNSGMIKIFNVTNGSSPVDSLDLSQGSLQARSVGGEVFNTYPVIITGTKAAIYPHAGVLKTNATYYVTVDDGVFTDAVGAYFAGISGSSTWQFSTKATGPANPASLVVATDNSGDFATVQGAVDSVTANNTTPTTINIANGNYVEIVNINHKNNLLLRGQSRKGTVISYANSSILNASTHFRMSTKVNANDIAFDNLTLTNSTAQDASQAEALMIESAAARIIVNNCDLDSYQDTVLANISTSKAYFNRTLIQGDVDFIWGGGNLFFTNCEVRYLIRSGNAAALGPNPSPSATDISTNGFSFVNCAFTTLPGANPNDTIGRTRSITNGNTALINCFISTNIGGWSADAVPTANYRNWYFGCTNDFGAAVTLSNGLALAANDPNVALAGSATAWLYGWQPALSPNILVQPVGASVSAGGSAAFSVSATGIPDPTYQWYDNGNPISGATAATYTLPATTRASAGNYTVVVSNASGSVTSSIAALVYTGNVAPVASPVTVSRFASISALKIPIATLAAGWSDVDGDAVAFTAVGTSTNGASLSSDASYVYYTAANPVNDQFTYTLTDAQSGAATGTVNVVVDTNNPAGLASGVTAASGSASLTFGGLAGYSYTVQVSTNLATWTDLLNTNMPVGGSFLFTDGAAPQPAGFYRLRFNP